MHIKHQAEFADIVYRKTIPDEFLVERSRHYYAS